MSFNPNEHMISLKGKDYLQVMWRLVWFREEHPDWGINTELIDFDSENKQAIFKASITDENGILKSSGFGSETARDFGDYIEKAETKAVGRSLAMLGYGTQFAPDLDEGERIVDSPVARKPAEVHNCDDCGKPIGNVRKKDGEVWTAGDIVKYSEIRFKRKLCPDCQKKALKEEK